VYCKFSYRPVDQSFCTKFHKSGPPDPVTGLNASADDGNHWANRGLSVPSLGKVNEVSWVNLPAYPSTFWLRGSELLQSRLSVHIHVTCWFSPFSAWLPPAVLISVACCQVTVLLAITQTLALPAYISILFAWVLTGSVRTYLFLWVIYTTHWLDRVRWASKCLHAARCLFLRYLWSNFVGEEKLSQFCSYSYSSVCIVRGVEVHTKEDSQNLAWTDHVLVANKLSASTGTVLVRHGLRCFAIAVVCSIDFSCT
jgi:hypothetical protein